MISILKYLIIRTPFNLSHHVSCICLVGEGKPSRYSKVKRTSVAIHGYNAITVLR